MQRRSSLLVMLAVVLAACSTAPAATAPRSIKVGAVFPLTGSQAALAKEQYAGVTLARDFVNQDGGVAGVPIALVTKNITTTADAGARVAELKRDGVQSVIGAYSSSLSMAVSAAAQANGLLYWEAGAVADQLTGRGYPLVFRVGATGTNLGSMSSRFAAEVLAPRLHRAPAQLRLVIVHNVDGYPTSVAEAVRKQAQQEGFPLVTEVRYDYHVPDWDSVIQQVRAARPDILVLASYIADGVDFRRAMLKAGLHVEAFIGSTMAQCMPDFGAMLGADAIGVFSSDRPGWDFNAGALSPSAQVMYHRFSEAYEDKFGTYPGEEALAGFSAAWTLFHYVMPRSGRPDSAALAASARNLDLPAGTLANGGGVKFATSEDLMGQNTRAPSVIWQWQGIRHNVTVYPSVFATGAPELIPLPR